MSTSCWQHPECQPDEIFVGNTDTNKDKSHFSGISYRLGEVAYDWNEKPMLTKRDSNIKPMFVKKSDYEKYDRIMLNRSNNARYGGKTNES